MDDICSGMNLLCSQKCALTSSSILWIALHRPHYLSRICDEHHMHIAKCDAGALILVDYIWFWRKRHWPEVYVLYEWQRVYVFFETLKMIDSTVPIAHDRHQNIWALLEIIFKSEYTSSVAILFDENIVFHGLSTFLEF